MSQAYDEIVHNLESMSAEEKRSLMELLRNQLPSEKGPDISAYKAAEREHLHAGERVRKAAQAAGKAWSELTSDTETKAANGSIAPFGWAKGRITIADDFDAPLEDFREYMR